jgi:hypothetical protein
MTSRTRLATTFLIAALLPWPGAAQAPGQNPGGGPGGFGGPGGPGNQPERKILAQFDKDKNKRLDAAERHDARLWLESQPQTGPGAFGRGRGGPGGPGGPGRGGMATGSPGQKVLPTQVKNYGSEPLYDPAVLRTFFFQFENDDWEKELMAFYNSDVEVPATLMVDGRSYRNVGLHFRGASSFFGVPAGLKHSINVSIDFVHDKQRLLGYKTLNLLNANEDATTMRTVLYLQAAREYLPAPKANFVRVVLNGESWGIYPSQEQYNGEFLGAWYKTTAGARWKVPGSPGARGGLEYVGDSVDAYKRTFEIKSKDDPKAWADLVRLCKTLNTTPAGQLEQALAPMLDVDETLRFLAVDNTLVNNDGYWTRASDYSIYQDAKGVFHIFPHDANETFAPGGGPGRGGPMGPPPGGGFFNPPGGMPPGGMPPGGMDQGRGPGGRGGFMMGGSATLDPLIGLNDASKPLRSKLLAVPALRNRYMTYVRQISTKWLDWNTLGPIVQKHQALIATDVKADTRKLERSEAFDEGIAALKRFADQRLAYLLAYKPQ